MDLLALSVVVLAVVAITFAVPWLEGRSSRFQALAMILAGGTILYVVGMLFFTLYDGPLSILVVPLWLVGGPVLLLTALVTLIRVVVAPPVRFARVIVPTVTLLITGIWTIEGRLINHALTLFAYQYVAVGNERLAVAFMRNHPTDDTAYVDGFRYPYFALNGGLEAAVYHEAGTVCVRVKNGPTEASLLIYVPPGVEPPVHEDTFQLADRWYFAPDENR